MRINYNLNKYFIILLDRTKFHYAIEQNMPHLKDSRWNFCFWCGKSYSSAKITF